jgi:glycosyltransferase involved in cell wall biosynthesis
MTRALFLWTQNASAYNGSLYLRTVLPSEFGGWHRLTFNDRLQRHEGRIGGRAMTNIPARGALATDYDVVIVRSAFPDLACLDQWRDAGVRVLVDLDDYVHGASEIPAIADWARGIPHAEAVMMSSDGIICSTPFIADRYSKFGPTYVAENGYDPASWDLRRDKHDGLVIGSHGWAQFGTGPLDWLPAVAAVMRRHRHVRFLGVGDMELGELRDEFGDRVELHAPVPLAEFPRVVNRMDVLIAPTEHIDFARARSDHRWLTAAALGIPAVVDPWTYGSVRDGITGLHATTSERAEHQLERLITDDALRARIADEAKREAASRAMPDAVRAWTDVLAG